jgi:putative ATP-dependent endonuclease of OLD family
MHISNIKIQNFRLFETLDLSLNAGLNVLVGENDSGKTALIDAIRYALGTNSNDRTFIMEEDFYEECDTLIIQITFVDVDAHAHRFVEHLSHQEYKDEEGNDKRRSVLHLQLHARKTGAERRGYPYIKTELKSGVDGNGLSIEAEIRDFLSATYLKPLRDAETELSAGRASRLSQILSSSKEVKNGMNEILAIIAAANEGLLADDAALKEAAENIQKNYLHELIFEQDKESIGAFIDISGIRQEEMEGLPANAKRRHLRSVLEGLSLALTKDRRMHGLGYHNLLFMGAELLLLEQEAENEFPLLLIEEPEAHLHPQLQMKLLQFINSKVSVSGVQCILSTHSPNISAKADPSEIIMLNQGKAFPLREGETELNGDDYKYLQKFLDATKSNVFFAKSLLFVEGDGENILLPEIARMLGRPLENYGVSVIKYDNSGSWKRFARLFLRAGKDGNQEEWNPSKICVLRDLDLWPACAEKKADDSNDYGFLDRKEPKKNGTGGNLDYWELISDGTGAENEARAAHFKARSDKHKKDGEETLERQNIKICISDRWTFEYCIAKYGLFSECCSALGIDTIEASDDEKATYIQGKVSKTDFAYNMADILRKQLADKAQGNIDVIKDKLKDDLVVIANAKKKAATDFSLALKEKLPPYIVEAIEYVTSPICEAEHTEEQGDDEPA